MKIGQAVATFHAGLLLSGVRADAPLKEPDPHESHSARGDASREISDRLTRSGVGAVYYS
jgi:hypothetical protein